MDAKPSETACRTVADVLITAELNSRASRAPDFEAENRALGLLAQEMGTNPRGVLQKCTELVMELCRADSAGISILEAGGSDGILRWHAASGAFAANLQGTTPREASPCGTTIARDSMLLFSQAGRFFPALRGVDPPVYENLLVPLKVDGEPIGTLSAMKHTAEGRFEAEDARLMASLARFASAALQVTGTLAEARDGIAALDERLQALREREERLAAIFTHASVGLSEIGLDGHFMRVNDELCRIVCRPREELLRIGIQDVTHPDDLPASQVAVRTALETRGRASLDKRYQRPDGTLVWANSTITCLQDAKGQIASLLAVTVDLTARREMEEQLRRSEEQLRLIVGSARDYAILVTDPQSGIVQWFPGAAAVYGWSAEEIIGQPYDLLFTPEDRAAGVPQQEADTARSAGVAPNVRWHMRKDRSRVFIEGRCMALRNPDGTLRGFLKIGQDVTERRAGEEQLARSEALFRTLTTGIQQLVFLSHSNGAATWISPQWCDYTGVGFAESLRFGWLEAVHPDDRELIRRRWSEAVAVGHIYVEHRIRHTDGTYRWHQTRARPLDPDDPAGGEWVGASTDVHHLRDLQETQGLLLAELQHRTRNLIGVVRSLASRTLASSLSLEDFQQRFAARLGALARVQGLLSRLETQQRVTFDDLVETELSGLGALDENGRSPQVHLRGERGVRLRSSTVQTFALALHELATNALKHGALSRPEGRLDVSWSVRIRPDGAARLHVEWRESGVPVPLGPDGAPPRRGFGREMIERALPYQLQAEIDYKISPDGVRCSIVLPISSEYGVLQNA
jgi:PAS domain S-box-containing protein